MRQFSASFVPKATWERWMSRKKGVCCQNIWCKRTHLKRGMLSSYCANKILIISRYLTLYFPIYLSHSSYFCAWINIFVLEKWRNRRNKNCLITHWAEKQTSGRIDFPSHDISYPIYVYIVFLPPQATRAEKGVWELTGEQAMLEIGLFVELKKEIVCWRSVVVFSVIEIINIF